MAAAMITDRGLRKKLTQEAIPKTPRKPSKRKASASTSKADKKNDLSSKKIKNLTGDPKLDLFRTYQPWVISTYGDLAKTKTITLKKYARILRTIRGEEFINSSESSKFRFWVKAKGFHIGKPPGYDAKPADGIVCRYSVADADGCPRGPDGQEIYSGSQGDSPLYIPSPPLKVDNSLLEIQMSDDSDAVQDLSERKSPEKKQPRKRRNTNRNNVPFVLNTPSPRPNTPFGINQSAAAPFTILTPSTVATSFLNPPVGIATPLTPTSLATIYPLPTKQKKGSNSSYDDSRNGDTHDLPQDLSQHAEGNENEFEMFGKLIASQLRKLPLSLALDTQLKIQTLVNAARIQAVYQQYSYAGPSQETLSVQALSNGILTSMASQGTFTNRDLGLRNHSPEDMNGEMKTDLCGGSDAED